MANALEKFDSRNAAFPALADFFPKFRAWSVGFDRDWKVLEDLQNSLIGDTPMYPPYNIKKVGKGKYEIEMAVAGFKKEDLHVELANNRLTIEGDREKKEESKEVDYVYKGIASTYFRQSFALADHLKVTKSEFKDGILRIELESEVPEKEKSQTIEIQ
jgi:molecular chaperone IbpA